MYRLLEGRHGVEAADCTGPENVWALLMKQCGLGDHIQSLPVIYDLVSRGIELEIYCKPDFWPLYQKLCLKTYSEDDICPGFLNIKGRRYGRVYSLREWGRDEDRATNGEAQVDRVTLFASFFGLDAPKNFEWVTPLGAKKENSKEYVVYSPQSSSEGGPNQRALIKEVETYYALKEKFDNIIWLGKPEGVLRKIVPTLEELVNLVYNAKAVLAVDNGVMNLAMSLGVPTLALFGPTDEEIVLKPFEHLPARREALRTEGNGECQRPCNLIPGFRGYRVNNKCTTITDCMNEHDPLSVAQSFYRFSQGELWQQPTKVANIDRILKEPALNR